MKKNLLFFTMLFMLIFYGQAQTVTIGDGTTGKYTMPVNTYYNYSYGNYSVVITFLPFSYHMPLLL